MHGLEHEVRAAVTMLLELDIVKVSPVRTVIWQTLSSLAVLPPRDPLPDRARQRASRVYQWQEERQNQQDHDPEYVAITAAYYSASAK